MPNLIDSGFTTNGINLAEKIRKILESQAGFILEQDLEEAPRRVIPKINTDYERIKEGFGIIRVNFVTGGHGIGYGENFSIEGRGKEVLMRAPKYVEDHYKGRPEKKPFIGKALSDASYEVHELLLREGFRVEENTSLNRYLKA